LAIQKLTNSTLNVSDKEKFSYLFDTMKQNRILEKWKSGNFIEHLDLLPSFDLSGHWVEYESYMQAKLLNCVPYQDGELLVRFPVNCAEDNQPHTHPISDRIVTVLEGDGEFICGINNKIYTFDITRGDVVYMPRGTLHTFKSLSDGMLVHSLHCPFVPFDDRLCLTYPKEKI
jgi:mannose-6-phosphate isomerase-like protein (cupin superfamily)